MQPEGALACSCCSPGELIWRQKSLHLESLREAIWVRLTIPALTVRSPDQASPKRVQRWARNGLRPPAVPDEAQAPASTGAVTGPWRVASSRRPQLIIHQSGDLLYSRNPLPAEAAYQVVVNEAGALGVSFLGGGFRQ